MIPISVLLVGTLVLALPVEGERVTLEVSAGHVTMYFDLKATKTELAGRMRRVRADRTTKRHSEDHPEMCAESRSREAGNCWQHHR